MGRRPSPPRLTRALRKRLLSLQMHQRPYIPYRNETDSGRVVNYVPTENDLRTLLAKVSLSDRVAELNHNLDELGKKLENSKELSLGERAEFVLDFVVTHLADLEPAAAAAMLYILLPILTGIISSGVWEEVVKAHFEVSPVTSATLVPAAGRQATSISGIIKSDRLNIIRSESGWLLVEWADRGTNTTKRGYVYGRYVDWETE
jgi:hypothetical protein